MSRLDEIGEEEFLHKLALWLKFHNPKVRVSIGDDALVLRDGTVVTSDSYEERVHFSQDYFSYRDIGCKSAAATLSDIAAMGAEPACLLVNLFCSPNLEVESIKEIYEGIEEVSSTVGAEIAGGDTVASDRLILSLTALGETEKPLLRSGARPGDYLYLSGFPGLSAVGRRILSAQMEGFPESRAKHLRPMPRIELGLKLTGLASACIDTSDGLSTDSRHLAAMSGVKLVIEHENLPRHPEVVRFSRESGISLDSLLLDGGEDYELLFTSPRTIPDELDGIPIHRIGRAENGEGTFLEVEGEQRLLPAGGYDHFLK